MAKRNYINGLVAGGVLGAVLGAIFSSRQQPDGMVQPRQMGDNAKRVLRGLSRGMLEMMRR